MTKHQRWAQMYKLLTFQFCRDFALKCKIWTIIKIFFIFINKT
jgi:hypothetical protein